MKSEARSLAFPLSASAAKVFLSSLERKDLMIKFSAGVEMEI